MVRDSTRRAIKNYKKRNPLQQTYWDRKAVAHSFATVPLTKNTKLAQAINANRLQYIDDLKSLKIDIENRLKEFGGN